MNKVILNKDNRYIEICELPEDDLAGKTKIRMSALEIHEDNTEWNDNGITWLEEYVKDNLDSFIGSPYVVSWLDEENQIPSDHGAMSYDDDGNVVFDGVAVGAVQDAFIDTVEINDVETKVVMTEGYIFNQRYDRFDKWLKQEVENGKVYGSVEINGKGKSKTIEYLDGNLDDDGNPKNGRVPTVFDFSGLAILYITDPADKNSVVFEVNTKKGGNDFVNMVNKGVVVELNKLSYNDIADLITWAFNKAMGLTNNYYEERYWIHRFYPESKEVVFDRWDEPGTYYMTTYDIDGNAVTIGDIVQVTEDWQPVSGAEPVEVNVGKNKKGGIESMDGEKITELSKQVGELQAEISKLSTAIEEKDTKIAEVNEALVAANKSLEELNTKYSELEVERNDYKEKKDALEKERLQAEINTYFEEEIPKNKFDEDEVKLLKEYVEKCDLDGLKKAESDLIVKKFKEKVADAEINTSPNGEDKGDLFFSTKEEKEDEVGSELF